MKSFFSSYRQDLPASIVVFFVALPLCLGIALASGAPLFSGIISGIIGGIVVGFFSKSSLGVSGPAAGLSVVVLGYIATLGGSWEAFLLAVVLTGVIQLIAGLLRMGTIAYYFPSSVVKGMLSGIGLIIVIKQLPHVFGYNSGDLNLGIFSEGISGILGIITFNTMIIAAIAMIILLVWDEVLVKKSKFLKTIPGPLVAVVSGIILSNIIYLKEGQIVQIPVSSDFGEFVGQFTTPDFSQFANPQIYFIALIMAIVASLETLLCVEATDKLDPERRVTPANHELKAQGIGNIISGLVGGLPITQVIVRSSANINFGGKSKLSTISHGFLLLISAVSIPSLLNMIPLATLACILLVVGYKLAKPAIFKQMYNLGAEQFVPFIATIIGMLVFDLLVGVGIGMAAAIYFVLYTNFRNSYHSVEDKEKGNRHMINLSEEVSFLNKGGILQMLQNIPEGSTVVIDGTKSKSIHYDVVEIIRDFRTNAKTKNITLEIKGINSRKFKK